MIVENYLSTKCVLWWCYIWNDNKPSNNVDNWWV